VIIDGQAPIDSYRHFASLQWLSLGFVTAFDIFALQAKNRATSLRCSGCRFARHGFDYSR
jgi:hypothetical protein